VSYRLLSDTKHAVCTHTARPPAGEFGAQLVVGLVVVLAHHQIMARRQVLETEKLAPLANAAPAGIV